MELAKLQKSEDLKKKQISSALDVGTSVAIKDFVQKEYNRIFGIFTEDDFEEMNDGEKTIFPAKIKTTNGESVAMNALPGKSGEKIGQLPPDAPVLVLRRTKTTDTIDGVTERWYEVDAQEDVISGWVFGGFLEFEK